MSDTFHSDVEDLEIAELFDAMRAAPQHTYQVLTKRANRVRRWWEWYQQRINIMRHTMIQWPANIWLGTSVESAMYLDRISQISRIAPVTFLSAEPLLGGLTGEDISWPVDLRVYTATGQLQWIIAGGESGLDCFIH